MPDRLPDNLKGIKLFRNDRSCLLLADDTTLFRYISAEYLEQTLVLLNCGLIENLVTERLLQPGTVRETGLSEHPLVIEHPLIGSISYPFEWPALALKDIALAIINIEETANKYGYTLADPGPYNVTIQEGKPVYLDYDSFVPIERVPIWRGYDTGFRDFILLPLELFSRNLHYLARLMLRDIGQRDIDINTRKLGGNKFRRSFLDRIVTTFTYRRENTD